MLNAEYEENKKVAEKLRLQQEAYDEKAKTKLNLMEKDHELKIARLEKHVEIAKLTGNKVDEDNNENE